MNSVRLPAWLTAPVFPGNDEKTRAAATLHALLAGFAVVMGINLIAACVFYTRKVESLVLAGLSILSALLMVSIWNARPRAAKT